MTITTSVVEVVYEIVSYTSIKTRHENVKYKTKLRLSSTQSEVQAQ
jgi:hypothetical protein